MPSSTDDQTNSRKTALITGCGRRRLGHVIAKHLAGLGYNIAVHYNRSKDLAQANAAEYEKRGVQAATFQADVSDESDVRKLVNDVLARFQTIDVLVTTASIWRSIPLEELTAEETVNSFRVNTLGTFLCCQHTGLAMAKQKSGGNIITIGDSLSAHPYVDYAAYFTSKGAIEGLTKSFAVELANRNPKIRVNCIAPGPVMFPENLSTEDRQRVTNSTLTKTANHPESVAMAVEFLINSPMMCGVVLPIDAGRNVGREQQARSGFPHTP